MCVFVVAPFFYLYGQRKWNETTSERWQRWSQRLEFAWYRMWKERDRQISVFDEIGICSTFRLPNVDVYSTHVAVHQKSNMRCTLVERMFYWYTHANPMCYLLINCVRMFFSYARFFLYCYLT